MNKIPWLIDCEKGDLILPGLLGIMIAHSRETVFNQLVFHEMGKRGIFNGSSGLRQAFSGSVISGSSRLSMTSELRLIPEPCHHLRKDCSQGFL